MNSKSLQTSVLLIEDDTTMATLISYNLVRENYIVMTSSAGEEGFAKATTSNPSIIIMDWLLPNRSGIEICEKLKSDPRTANIPIIIISCRSNGLDKAIGLERGADDYLAKPFSVRELIARIKAVSRRVHCVVSDNKLTFENLEMNLSTNSVIAYQKDGEQIEINLNPIEFRILQLLMTKPGYLITRNMIMNRIWREKSKYDPNDEEDKIRKERTVNVHMTRVRNALAAVDSVKICTSKGSESGYKLISIKRD